MRRYAGAEEMRERSRCCRDKQVPRRLAGAVEISKWGGGSRC